MGTISFVIMLMVAHSGDHGNCSQRLEKTAPKPYKSDASVKIWFLKVRLAEWRKLTPFQLWINACHQWRSERKLLFKWAKCLIFLTLAAVRYILVTNILRGFTTLLACWSNRTSDKISLLVAFLQCNRLVSCCFIQLSLSSGCLACIFWVLGMIPRKIRQWDGPSTISIARGIPRYFAMFIIVCKLL